MRTCCSAIVAVSPRTHARCALRRAFRSGRFSVVRGAVYLKEGNKYAVKVVENNSLGDEENLDALETEVRSPPTQGVAAAAASARHCSSGVL